MSRLSSAAPAAERRGFWRRSRRALPPLAVVAGSVLAAIVMIVNKPPLKEAAPRIEGVPVEIAEVLRQTLQVRVHSQGTVRPAVQTVLASEVPGRVVEISPNFVVGGFFSAGEVLLRLDDRDFRARLTQAEAALASAQSLLALERGRAESARRDWMELGGDDRGSKATELALRKPQLAEAEARVQSAGAQLEEARLALERTVIRAPYNGLLRERMANPGQFVGVGKELAAIYATDSAEVSLALPENKLAYIRLPAADGKAGARALLHAEPEDGKSRSWLAQLVRSAGVFNERNRTLSVIARVEDPYGLRRRAPDYEPLRFGSFVRAVIEGRRFPKLIALPSSLLRAGDKIWVVDKDGLLQNRSVSALQTGNEQVYVRGGLRDGDRVCLTPLGNVLPGSPARVIRSVPAGRIFERRNADGAASGGASGNGDRDAKGGAAGGRMPPTGDSS